MEPNNHQPTSDPASDTEASDLVAELEARRAAAGIVISDEPQDPFAKFRVPALTPEQIAERQAQQAGFEAAEREAEISRNLNSFYAAAGDRYRSCTFDGWEYSKTPKHAEYQRKVLSAVRSYAAAVCLRTSGEGLVLYGPCGTGKDHLAVVVAATAIRAGLSVRYINGQDWFGSIRDAMDTDGLSEAQIINRVARYDVAVISDPLPPIGSLSQHQATMLYRAVQNRYAAGKPTIVTLNVSSDDEADSRIGVPTWDRIRHGALSVLCRWPSYRNPAREIKP